MRYGLTVTLILCTATLASAQPLTNFADKLGLLETNIINGVEVWVVKNPSAKSATTMTKAENKQERARDIQHFGEPDTSWMMTNAGWMRRRSQAMMATNQWKTTVAIPLGITPKETLWNHHCTRPESDSGLVSISATQMVWNCGCGKSGTNSYHLVSSKLSSVPPEIIPPTVEPRHLNHSHYIAQHYLTRAAWVFEGVRMTKRGKIPAINTTRTASTLETVALPEPMFTIEKETLAPDVITITITCKTNGLWDVETSTDLKNWTPINDWRTNNPRWFVGSPSALVPRMAGHEGNQCQFYRMKFKP